MTWEEALSYSAVIKEIAHEWAYRVSEASLEEDLSQHLYIKLVEGVDPSKATKDTHAYVKAACWKIAEKFMRSKRHGVWKYLSLTDLQEQQGWQIDDDGQVRLPSQRKRYEEDWSPSNTINRF